MRDPLQELRSGKDFLPRGGHQGALAALARGEAQYTETRALAQGFASDLSVRFTTALWRLATQWAEICETAEGASIECL
jgi:hypothetical protein